jgi:hypothetical protein
MREEWFNGTIASRGRYPGDQCNGMAGDSAMTTILIVILILILVGALPSWGYSRNWGYGPSGLVTILLVILIVMMLTGRL